MLSTGQVLIWLQQSNPDREITEETLRRAIRVNPHLRPETVGGAYVWLVTDVEKIARHLELVVSADRVMTSAELTRDS